MKLRVNIFPYLAVSRRRTHLGQEDENDGDGDVHLDLHELEHEREVRAQHRHEHAPSRRQTTARAYLYHLLVIWEEQRKPLKHVIKSGEHLFLAFFFISTLRAAYDLIFGIAYCARHKTTKDWCYFSKLQFLQLVSKEFWKITKLWCRWTTTQWF